MMNTLESLRKALASFGLGPKEVEGLGDDTAKLADLVTRYGQYEAGSAPKTLLVIGQCGDGKSTLVNALRDEAFGDGPCDADEDADGVTKEITTYPGLPIHGQQIEIMDTPGVGDGTISVASLVGMIQEALGASKIDGVIVTTKITDGRMTMGAQVVQKLVESKAFRGEGIHDKWKNIILCGTMRDMAEASKPKSIEAFELDKKVVKDNGAPKGVVASFFKNAPEGWGKYAMVHQSDYSQLQEAVAQLPNVPIQYKKLNPTELSSLLAETIGVDADELKKEFEDELKKAEERFQQMLADRDAKYADDLAKADEAHKAELLQMEAKRKEDAEKMKSDMQKIQELQAKDKEEAERQRKADAEAHAKRMQEIEKKWADDHAQMQKKMDEERTQMRKEVEAREAEERRKKDSAELELQRLDTLRRQIAIGWHGGGGFDGGCGPTGGGRHGGGGGGGRTYHTGPRGGVYYINSNGKKTYVRR